MACEHGTKRAPSIDQVANALLLCLYQKPAHDSIYQKMKWIGLFESQVWDWFV
jgi:hypothetical protein